MQFISGRLKSPRSINLMLPTRETEVKMFWYVWGGDCGGTYTQQQRRGEEDSIFIAIISELMSVVIMWEGNELEIAIMTLLPTEPLSL